ncbi:sensor histidine kinase [Kineococcus gypseus]|uniref:sensor histidine kinase n=1 Tax=Kineococcus gypseus TaxID=1637102 RepID=UPI003D7D2AE2
MDVLGVPAQPAEAARLAALHEYAVLDAPAEDELDDVVRAAAVLAGVPHATLNLIDEHRQCQLTTVGFEGADSPRSESMCALHFSDGDLVHVQDASQDARFRANPWVDGRRAQVRFYASAPLITPAGHVLGSLCVFDTVTGQLSAAQISALEGLARVVVALFERRRQARLAQQLAVQAEQLAAEAAEQRALAQLMTAEAEARDELNRAVLETIDVGVVAAGPDGRLTVFNRAARRMHGLDADASVDPADHASVYSLYAADGVSALRPEQVPLQRALREGTVRDVEMVIAPAHRAPITVRVSGRTMSRADGTALGAVVAQSDITAIRARKRELEAALGELERSNGELAQFAGTVSHDLNSPLTVVAGYLEMLQDCYGEQLEEQARSWIATARAGTARMKELIGALLAYAQAGAESCRREQVQVREVFEQAVLDLRAVVKDSGARISAQRLPAVHGDAVLLRQLLQNLIGNAIKYRSPQRPCQVVLTAVRDREGWTFSVIDNGIGIPPEQRRSVFAMFAQVDPAARAGHGIGLATCQRIVARHGGRIWAEATPGGGTTIRFTLPQRLSPLDS